LIMKLSLMRLSGYECKIFDLDQLGLTSFKLD
jgi:hypothetical protein